MKTTVWVSSWTACAACCVLSGCCTSTKSAGCGQTCATTQIVNPLPPHYENYTPPSAALSPIPSFPAAIAPAPTENELPPPPAAKSQIVPDEWENFEHADERPDPDFH
ncbi:MAG: hypothetical protein U0872_11045 [Planctomycetaceae bacterium]